MAGADPVDEGESNLLTRCAVDSGVGNRLTRRAHFHRLTGDGRARRLHGMPMRLLDRRAAGRQLADLVSGYRSRANTLVLGLPRGGVPVAYEVARALSLPLDVLVVRKLGVPGQEELAFGAVASGGVRVLNAGVIAAVGLDADAIERITAREQREVARRDADYRAGRPLATITGRTVILVDDGLATGATMAAAIAAVRSQHPDRIVVAVPVASVEASRAVGAQADALVTIMTPEPFDGVGRWYVDFSQTSDEEVRQMLRDAQPALAPDAAH